MESDLLRIEKLLLQYIDLIGKEYPNVNTSAILERINDGHKIVEFNDSSSISFIVRNGTLLLPKYAYTIFPMFEKYENYGINPNHHKNIEDYLDTDTTYYDYIEHVIKSGMTTFDYFQESLLHETMHICGSFGGSPLEEGINELKTRELAQKYNINIAAYGYSKEVEIAKKLQGIIGKEIMDELTFISRGRRRDFLLEKRGRDIADLYDLISNDMWEKSKGYNEKLSQISNPYEKAQLYETIDYGESHKKLDEFLKEKGNDKIF